MDDYPAFLLVTLLACMAPGVDTAITVRNTVARGAGAGVRAAIGASTGQLVWGAVTAAGLAALVTSSPVALAALRAAGAAYLVCLGVAALRSDAELAPQTAPRRRSPYVEGLAGNLLNPKTALFFSALLPQFVEAADPLWWPAALTLTTAVVSSSWLTVAVVLLRRFRRALERPAIKRRVDRALGVALVALGVRVALST